MNEQRWYKFVFPIKSYRKNRARVWIDLFILDRIVREIMSRHKSKITLWRIHRRWANDSFGHQFSFDCFTDAKTKTAIGVYIAYHSADYQWLKKNDLLQGSFFISHDGKLPYSIADDYSTSHWSKELKKSWPYWIMGCSEMMLQLVGEVCKHKVKMSRRKGNPSTQLYYTQVIKEVNKVWQENGRHAFLHHLNAVFGYLPTLVSF